MKLLTLALLCAASLFTGCCKCSEERDFEIFQAGELSGVSYAEKVLNGKIASPTNATDVLRRSRAEFQKLKLP